ncbi:MAG: hypothetical protein IT307_20280, partial [Chloroflexi bacterium]|nr:hypothetical protein [Chloroflexota bacterium]
SVTTIPQDLKLRGLTPKHIFRKAMRGILPEPIVKRPKKGFNIPVATWLHGPLRGLVEDVFSERSLRDEGIFNPAYVRGLLDEHQARRRDHRKLLWTLLVFELWHARLRQRPTLDLAPTRSVTRQ